MNSTGNSSQHSYHNITVTALCEATVGVRIPTVLGTEGYVAVSNFFPF